MQRPLFARALIVTATTCVWLAQANAAPPTVTPSPGYDARLQEQRAAGHAAAQSTATGGSGPVIGPHVRKTHHRAH